MNFIMYDMFKKIADLFNLKNIFYNYESGKEHSYDDDEPFVLSSNLCWKYANYEDACFDSLRPLNDYKFYTAMNNTEIILTEEIVNVLPFILGALKKQGHNYIMFEFWENKETQTIESRLFIISDKRADKTLTYNFDCNGFDFSTINKNYAFKICEKNLLIIMVLAQIFNNFNDWRIF